MGILPNPFGSLRRQVVQDNPQQPHEVEQYQEVISPYQGSGVVRQSEDISKWEMETEPLVQNIYHELLGETKRSGVWEQDCKKKRVMNELGASEFVNEIRTRVNINMQMSLLDEKIIREMPARAGMIFADKLEDNWVDWEIIPTESNFESIATQLVDLLDICLRIAKGGGMRVHRERRGIKTVYSQPPNDGGMF